MAMDPTRDAIAILSAASAEVQRSVMAWLRERHQIHPLEEKWGVSAELILEAISRSSDLSQRGMRGLIAEAYFDQLVSSGVPGWNREQITGNPPFDCLLKSKQGTIRIQVKLQRSKNGQPMTANQGYRRLSADKLLVETQKTRAGANEAGENTRPYRFGQFDLLAVSVEPSTRDWSQFRYTLERWLLPDPNNPTMISKFQPVSLVPNEDWTDCLETAIEWYFTDSKKSIAP